MNLKTILISTYELGRQPFGLASPAAWLREQGIEVNCLDLSLEALDRDLVEAADLIAFYVPMHMGARMAVPVIQQVQQINPTAHLCCYGLYAPVSEDYLRLQGVDTILGGEFETGLVNLAERLKQNKQSSSSSQPSPEANQQGTGRPAAPQPEPRIALDRQNFLIPNRAGLPALENYAHLIDGNGQHLTVGYTEASRGCKHLCRHCPIVPVYGGRFRIVQREVVLADIRQQVEAGAQHITFGDPDFFNGPGHAIPIVTSLHEEFPALTYDVTIKVEHLLKHAQHLETLKQTGCLFVTSAVESFDDRILELFEKHHTQADFEAALKLCRNAALMLVPTFVAFTPWTTLAGYRRFLAEIVRLDLVDQVSPIQCAIRLLILPGSRLLELPEVQDAVGELDESKLSYTWRNPDPRVDKLQKDLEHMVQRCAAKDLPRREVFRRIWKRAYEGMGDAAGQVLFPKLPAWSRFVPYLTEPWYC